MAESSEYFQPEESENFQPMLEIFPESQESMEIEEIGDSLMNLGIDNRNNNELPESSKSTMTEESKHDDQHELDYTGCLVGFTAKTLNEIYEVYQKHAFAIGFGVRQSTTRYTQGEPKTIKGKDFVCSKEGFRVKPKVRKTPPPPNQKQKRVKQVPITRTSCKAFIRAKKIVMVCLKLKSI
ncbi:uncharacterized protein LOC110692574 [Chenopodium quinoa]|uniref:FAR1 domain-containing protein n=1 Tax=Chenopodium quinoa TaxID=63459 RepID=A0A803MUB8_CHEQI|nr:uncharacterized protein LOC110692574 [Chenopodium quinoa]